MISVKVENDSKEATNIIKCQVTARKVATNASPSVVNNDRLLSELSVLRGKYNGAVFDLQKAKTAINSSETEMKCLKAENKSLMQQIKKSMDELNEIYKKNKIDLASFRREKEKLSAEIRNLKKENNELRARLKQVQSNIGHDKKNENNVYEVETILDHREEKSGRFFLVRWEGFGAEEDSWVFEKDLACPALLKSYLKQKK